MRIRPKLFFIISFIAFAQIALAQVVGVIPNPENNLAKRIMNFSLGSSYENYKANGGNVDFKLLVYDNQQDRNSLLNQLAFGLGEKYKEELYVLVWDDMRISLVDQKEKQKELVAKLESVSKRFKLENNIRYEIYSEQKRLNVIYQKTVDSLINEQRLKYIAIRNLLQSENDSLRIANESVVKTLEKKLEEIKNQYESQIDHLNGQQRAKILKLPQANFVKNKKVIQLTYSTLINELITKGNTHIKDFIAKYDFENEYLKNQREAKLKQIDEKITEINTRLEDLKNNLEFTLPPRPTVDEWKVRQKMEGL